MNLTAEDRVALLLGRAIMRAEALQVQNENLRAQIAAGEKPKLRRPWRRRRSSEPRELERRD